MALNPISAWHMQQTTLLIGQWPHRAPNCCILDSDPSHFRKFGKDIVNWDVVLYKHCSLPRINKLPGPLLLTALHLRVLLIQRAGQ